MVTTDEKTQKLIENTTKDGKEKTTPKITRQIAHFLIDFQVVTTSISFIIALQFKSFMEEVVFFILLRFFKIKKHGIFSSFITFMLTLILAFLFVRYIFYKFIYTEEVDKETILKKAIHEKRTEAVKEKVKQQPDMKKKIEDTTNLITIKDKNNENYNEKYNEKYENNNSNNDYYYNYEMMNNYGLL